MAGKRYSKQREEIYRYLRSSFEHPTAEMVYAELKQTMPCLSLGTVYRNLNYLVEEGRVIRFPLSVERYDAHVEPHSHFLCTRCGGLSDLEVEYDAGLDQAARDASDHIVSSHTLIFQGICSNCAQMLDQVCAGDE